MHKHSISDTEKTRRARRLSEAEAINMLGINRLPSSEDQAVFDLYIEGKIDGQQVLETFIKKYKEPLQP